MGDNRVTATMVELNMSKNDQATLRDYLDTSKVLPIGAFYKTSTAQAITDALNYLTAKQDGGVYVPADKSNKATQIVSSVDKSGKLKINYITSNYRYPINKEARPFTGDAWQIGDLVYNTDTDKNKCLGWVCTEAGTPGSWGVIGFIRNWATELEEVSALPDPGPMQINRQLVCGGRAYICKLVDGEYNWYWMDYAYGNTSQHPTTDLRVGLPYYNIQTGLPEWWNGSEWVAVAKANHTHEDQGASDTPKYATKSVSDSSDTLIYLPNSREGFLSVDLKGKSGSVASELSIASLENLAKFDELVKIDDTNSSYQVDGDTLTLVKSTEVTSQVQVAKIPIKVKAGSQFRCYYDLEATNNAKIIVGMKTTGIVASFKPDGSVNCDFEGTEDIDAELIFMFDTSTKINSIAYLKNFFLVDIANKSIDFVLEDYIPNQEIRCISGFAADELIDNTFYKRVVDLRLYEYGDDVELVNQGTFISDGYLVILQNHKHSYLGRSMYLPKNDQTVSPIRLTGFTTDTYDNVRLGDDSSLKVGISSEGMVAYNIPNSVVNKSAVTYYLKYLAARLSSAIMVPLAEPITSEMVMYPAPIRCHTRGVLMLSKANVNVDIKYPSNAAAVTEMTADILLKVANQRIKYNEAPLSWSDDMTWSKAATNNKNWRGEKNA